ncbi:MAG: sulfide-dependent adenosine diphosphate thiazole synthase [Spirochaetota bacterium]
MELNEVTITSAIIDRYFQRLKDCLASDVAIVGGGPSGLVAGYYLSKQNIKTILFERKLSIGGGMWGGGMQFNEIVVQENALPILEEFDVHYTKYADNYYTADAIESVCTIASKAIKAGLTIFNCISVEDIMMREDRICGLVINWSAVDIAKLHVDPLTIQSKYVIDTTGHDTEVVKVVVKKVPGKLNTPTGTIEGEKSMWAEKAERLTLENTREIFPGLFVAGMAANAVFGGPRMGPIFGGMLLSGKKVADEIVKKSKQVTI